MEPMGAAEPPTAEKEEGEGTARGATEQQEAIATKSKNTKKLIPLLITKLLEQSTLVAALLFLVGLVAVPLLPVYGARNVFFDENALLAYNSASTFTEQQVRA